MRASNVDLHGWHDAPHFYEIRVLGSLGEDWAEWFDGLAVTTDGEGATLLRGIVPDQAALYGLLARLRDLGLPLVSVRQMG